MSHHFKKKPTEDTIISSTISEYTFSSLTCASLVNEILLNLLFQKSQIPYLFSRLKDAVNNKNTDKTEAKDNNYFVLKNHFNTALEVKKALEEIMDSTKSLFVRFGNHIKKVVIVFGSTPYLPKEVFTIDISNIESFHTERTHFHENIKKLRKTLRNLFFSETWMDLISNPIPCTNTYIFLNVTDVVTNKLDWSETIFGPSKQSSFSGKVKHTIVKIDCDNEKSRDCCERFKIFEDEKEMSAFCDDEIKSDLIWLESKTVVKGFKDYFINKVSVSDIW